MISLVQFTSIHLNIFNCFPNWLLAFDFSYYVVNLKSNRYVTTLIVLPCLMYEWVIDIVFLMLHFPEFLFIQTFCYSCTIYLHSSFVIYVTFCICLDLIDTLYYQIWVLIRQREVRLAQLKRNHLAPRK